MWSYRLRWVLIATGVLLGGFFAWYEGEHQTHTSDYKPWIAVAALVGIGLIDLLTKMQEASRAKGRLSGEDFLDNYTALLTNAIAALQDVHSYNDVQIHEAQTKILRLITAVVVLFHPEAEGLGINANVMQNERVEDHSAQDRFNGYVHFSDPVRGAGSYAGVLCVKAWAKPPRAVPLNFALPVDKDDRRVLFGAPRTFVSGQEIVIANVHNKKEVNRELSGQPDDVRDAILAFFARQKYKTFMSLAVKNSDRTVAVLNLQADQPGVFGNQARQAEVRKFVDPFCTILGIMVTQSLQPRPAPGP